MLEITQSQGNDKTIRSENQNHSRDQSPEGPEQSPDQSPERVPFQDPNVNRQSFNEFSHLRPPNMEKTDKEVEREKVALSE
jgi:hypothetical protein